MPAQTTRSLLTLFEQEQVLGAGTGRVARQLSYGGANQGAMDNTYADLCAMTVAGPVPQFRMDHTYSNGVLATSAWMDPCDGTEVLRVADRDVDPSTGLIAISRDASGVATQYRYDAMARLTSERPEAEAWRHYRYHLPTATDPSLPRLTIEQCANGLTTCSGSNLLGWKRSHYNGLGRMTQESVPFRGRAGGGEPLADLR